MVEKQEKILFVGNSFTFYWNLPNQVEKMAQQQNIQWDVSQTTAGGATLRDHWQGNKNLKPKSCYLKLCTIELSFKIKALTLLSLRISLNATSLT
jgi:hypothetical protein